MTEPTDYLGSLAALHAGEAYRPSLSVIHPRVTGRLW